MKKLLAITFVVLMALRPMVPALASGEDCGMPPGVQYDNMVAFQHQKNKLFGGCKKKCNHTCTIKTKRVAEELTLAAP